MSVLTFEELPIQGRKVLLRVDFNVPLDENGHITDDTRIRESLPTIRALLEKNASVILMSHLGRPDGKQNPKYSLKPVAIALEKQLKKPVKMATDSSGKMVKEMASELKPGEMLLLENLRFNPAEENPKENPNFARELASLGDFYIDDAFGTAHRKHTSTYEVPRLFAGKRGIGLLMQKELQFLQTILKKPEHPFIAVIGGAKISTKLGLLQALSNQVDFILIGGAMAYTLLKAKGMEIGDSLCEEKKLSEAKQLLDLGPKLVLPVDHIIRKGKETKTVSNEQGIPSGWQGVDIGPKTIELFTSHLQKARLIFWNGPLGVFEEPPFNEGTKKVAMAIIATSAITIVGGGDSAAALQQLKLADKVTHLSTGGGATLEYLEKGTLPGVEILE